MSWVVFARVLPAVALLPLGGAAVRLLLGGVMGWYLAAFAPPAPPLTVGALLAEIGAGAALGLVAGLPARAAGALQADGPPALGLLGPLLAWGVFFGMGGPALWMAGLGESLRAPPMALDPLAAGAATLYAVVMLGAPTWAVALALGPLGAWIDRLGRPGLGRGLAVAVRPALTAVALAAALPLLLDALREAWLAVLAIGGAGG